MMQPLPITVKDPMRPTDLIVTQTIEHQLIEILNIGLPISTYMFFEVWLHIIDTKYAT